MLAKQATAAAEPSDLQSALDADVAELLPPLATAPETPPAKRIFKLLARKFTGRSEPPALSTIVSPGDAARPDTAEDEARRSGDGAPALSPSQLADGQQPAASPSAHTDAGPADGLMLSPPVPVSVQPPARSPAADTAASPTAPAAPPTDVPTDLAPASASANGDAAADADADGDGECGTPCTPSSRPPPSPSAHDSVFGFDPSLVLSGDDLKRWGLAVQQIDKDLPRTLTGVTLYPELSKEKRLALRRVLLAYAQHNTGVGFCQGMNFLAYILLVVLPEEAAFWALGAIVEDILPGYFTQAMIAAQVDQSVLESLVEERLADVAATLADAAVPLGCVSAPWFICAFVTSLPWNTLLRVWDVMLLERSRTVLFQVAMSLIHFKAAAIAATSDSGELITLLQSLAPSCTVRLPLPLPFSVLGFPRYLAAWASGAEARSSLSSFSCARTCSIVVFERVRYSRIFRIFRIFRISPART